MTFKVKTKGQNEGEKLLVPKLRFKEFHNKWIKLRLKDISNDISYGMNSAATDFDGINKYIRITDINEDTSLYNNSNPVSPSGYLDDKFLLQENDILFARTGASTGKTYLYNKDDGKLYFAGFLIRASIKKDYNSRFVFEQTKLNKFNNWVKIMSIRSGQPGINSTEYGNYEISITNSKEQEKIAKFVSLLDKKIELQQRRIEALKIYKKGLISHIFNGIHSTKKLKNIVNFQNGKSYENLVDITGNYNLISLNSITIDGKLNKFMKKIKSDLPISTLNKNDIVMIMSDVGHGDFLGVSAIIPNDNVYVLNQRVGLLRIKDNTIPSYLLYAINNLQSYFKKYGQGSSQLNLLKEDILNADIPYIDIHFQEDLSNFCILLDKKIFNAEFKLENLKNLKKSLLQQMFI